MTHTTTDTISAPRREPRPDVQNRIRALQEELIRPETINTLTPATLEAFRDHGRLHASLEENIPEARRAIDALAEVGISLRDVTDRLLEDGLRTFVVAFNTLLDAIAAKQRGNHA